MSLGPGKSAVSTSKLRDPTTDPLTRSIQTTLGAAVKSLSGYPRGTINSPLRTMKRVIDPATSIRWVMASPTGSKTRMFSSDPSKFPPLEPTTMFPEESAFNPERNPTVFPVESVMGNESTTPLGRSILYRFESLLQVT